MITTKSIEAAGAYRAAWMRVGIREAGAGCAPRAGFPDEVARKAYNEGWTAVRVRDVLGTARSRIPSRLTAGSAEVRAARDEIRTPRAAWEETAVDMVAMQYGR